MLCLLFADSLATRQNQRNPPMNDPLQKAWTRVTRQLADAGRRIDRLTEGRGPQERAEGYRFLTRVLSAMATFQVEQSPELPGFEQVMSPTRKFYVDNPDTLYHRASLNPRLGYRVRGRRGDALYLAFCVYGANRILANLHDEDLVFDAHGRFELILSPARPAGAVNWLLLPIGARTLITRQYFTRRDRLPAELEIELLDPRAPSTAPTEPAMAARLIGLGEGVARTLQVTERASTAWLERPNEITIDSADDDLAALFATPDNHYLGGWYRLAEDEMLVMEGRAPACRYWSVQLCSRWLESHDYRNRQVILNHEQVELTPDGTFRIVVAGRDPGVPSWLDTGGGREGGVIFRWLLPRGKIPRPAFYVEKSEDETEKRTIDTLYG
uniref:DUF1214 domain-containing protein n=1 Tax=Candidatus Kentrum sp. DK TaxID=2126562 RepID=A0A450T9G6_9GAMM|nr:MAG: Protein of unknown function (DUF1214) [Candidatus Kentron sp. DK]